MMTSSSSSSSSSSKQQHSSKKALQSILATRLNNLTIPTTSSSLSPDHEFDFNDVFGPTSSSNPNPNPNNSIFLGDPQIIHNRSHSFIGPSPRYTLSKSLPFSHDFDAESSSEEENEVEKVENVEVGKMGIGYRIGPGDFEIMRVIGKGSFGKVFQVRRRDRSVVNGDGGDGVIGDGIYAMKVMRKDTIIKNNHVDYMKAERDILTKVVHPFVVQLRYSFQTKTKLYLILDFINGGHLFFHLYRQGIFSEDQARVYTAEIVSAVSHLHQRGIVHRDLKPENILMDADGHVMLTDFGLAKEIDESSRSNSMCGTTEYMAPEILLAKGHNKNADWWSVGILCKLNSFWEGTPSLRLGSGPRGSDDIKGHKWFKTINWKKLDSRELQPKFKPDISGEECTENFDKCWTAMPLDDSPAPTPTGGEQFSMLHKVHLTLSVLTSPE
ncbi:serine/threonine-protein kinase AtPK1/AtPK6-like protein [Tanacetum coccineum]